MEDSHPHHPDAHGLLPLAIKLLIIVASFALASSVGFFLHPHLLPFLSHSLPQFWTSACAWLTAPVLFLLLNLVVGTLYFSSTFLNKPSPSNPSHARSPSPSPAANEVDATDVVAPPAAPTNSSRASGGGLRARIEKSKPFSRIIRSKSEQIPPSLLKAEASGSRLKKAGTFEAGAKGSRKPMVIVADPPEDEGGVPPAGHEEVDKKAEDFISRFYHKVKLQRLDSLLRNQQQGQA